MKTTLKRGVGRGAHVNGNGHAVFPPGTVSAVTRYEQPPPPKRSGWAIVGRVLVVMLLVLLSIALAIAGGAYLWFHREVAAVQAHSVGVKRAQKQLDVPLPGQAAIALVLGYDARRGADAGGGARSDTIMMIRADPKSHTVSLLSFPRDLVVPIYCSNSAEPITDDKINSAYDRCGPSGTLDTVKHLTGLPVNYLITVNFHGFKQIVDDMHGVWLFVDRRYYNKNVGTEATNYANINLQPGYQRLTGGAALEFVRFRHTDSDFVRLARQQEFVRALKDQLSQHLSILDVPKIVSAITQNVEVGGHPSDATVIRYAYFALTLPGGHILQDTINAVSGYSEVTAPESSIQQAVQQFVNPDVSVSKVANATALGVKAKVKHAAPPVKDTSVTVLNGNGVPGSAANANYLLAQRGYLTVLPPHGREPNAPTQSYFHTQVYYNAKLKGAKAAAVQLQKLIAPADAKPIPKDPALRALDPGSMIVLVTGETFHNALTSPAPTTAAAVVPARTPANVGFDSGPGHELLDPLVKKMPFPLEVPTILEATSEPDTLPTDVPVRPYTIYQGYKAVTLVFHTGSLNQFWDVEETNWPDPPILGDKSFQHDLGGREFDEYWNGPHLHMIVLRVGNNSYWVVNTLQDDLSNTTMIAIAKGLKPMSGPKSHK
jgi:LCP family protein required for cell wall assembly